MWRPWASTPLFFSCAVGRTNGSQNKIWGMISDVEITIGIPYLPTHIWGGSCYRETNILLIQAQCILKVVCMPYLQYTQLLFFFFFFYKLTWEHTFFYVKSSIKNFPFWKIIFIKQIRNHTNKLVYLRSQVEKKVLSRTIIGPFSSNFWSQPLLALTVKYWSSMTLEKRTQHPMPVSPICPHPPSGHGRSGTQSANAICTSQKAKAIPKSWWFLLSFSQNSLIYLIIWLKYLVSQICSLVSLVTFVRWLDTD